MASAPLNPGLGGERLLCSLPPHLLREISFLARMPEWLIYSEWGIFLILFFLLSASPIKKPAEFSSSKAGGTFSVSLIDL